MNIKQIIEIIKNGEKRNVELKLSYNKLPSNLFESICAFLNRNGGHIILGVNDNKKIVGVDKEYVENLKKDFVTLCNNQQKISPCVYLEIKDYKIDNKIILYIFVHESSEVHRTNGRIYDRNEDGDFDITNSTIQVSSVYLRKCQTYIENKVYPYATIDDLRADLIARARKIAVIRDNDHPWGKMNDMELLRSASLYQTDHQTGKSGVTLAGILLFGKDSTIMSVLPYHRTDALLRVKDVERYDDRDDIRTNLIESYDRLMAFIEKHLPDKFYLEDDVRINVRNKIARELVANMLIHRDFSNPAVARLIIKENEIYTENANRPRMIGYINIDNYIPYPKNPVIAQVFKEIGFADELGSGVRKMTKYTKIYSKNVPVFDEDDMFRVHIPLLKESRVQDSEHDGVQDREHDRVQDNIKYQLQILDYCVVPRTRQEIMNYLGLSARRSFNENVLKPLIEKEDIILTIPEKPNSKYQRYVRKNKNLAIEEKSNLLLSEHDRVQDREHDRVQDNIKYQLQILDYCVVPRTRQEIMNYLDLSARRSFNENVLKPLIEKEDIVLTIPEKPNSKYQKYIKNTNKKEG